jgi:hypothetical protein
MSRTNRRHFRPNCEILADPPACAPRCAAVCHGRRLAPRSSLWSVGDGRHTRGRAATTRMRKVTCPDCGYTEDGALLDAGRLPTCRCGEATRPESAADLALCGLIGQDDIPAAMWTAICRENGREEAIVRKGPAYKAYAASGRGHLDSRRVGAAHCARPGCPRWVADGAERCAAGHPRHEGSARGRGHALLDVAVDLTPA